MRHVVASKISLDQNEKMYQEAYNNNIMRVYVSEVATQGGP